MRTPKPMRQLLMRQLFWRWQSSPLRRRVDVVENWIILVMWVVIALGGALAGTVTAHAVGTSFAQLRNDRHVTRAVLVESPARALQVGPTDVYGHVLGRVRWTASDGSTHTGVVRVNSGLKTGSQVDVWVNGQGRLTGAPPSAYAATIEAGALGAGAAIAFGGAVFASGRLGRWQLDRRRYDQWGREWDRLGSTWGR
ncbi:Rv1733c family protein, partial [Streptomyces antnestii]